MAQLTKLTIPITGSTLLLRKSLTGAKSMLRGFVSSVSRSAVSIVSSMAVIGAALTGIAVSALAGIIRSVSGTIKSLARMSDVLGLSIQDLQRLKVAAINADVEFNKVTQGIKHFTRIIADANAGSFKAAATLSNLGLSVDTINHLSMEDKLANVAEELHTYTIGAERAEIATRLFGGAGEDMMRFLARGKSGLAEAREEARRMGLELSRVDAESIKIASAEMTKFRISSDGAKQILVAELAPAVTALIRMFNEWAGGTDNLGDKMRRLAEFLVDLLTGIIEMGGKVIAIWKGIQAVITKVIQFILEGVAGLDELTGNKIFGGAAQTFADEIGKTADNLWETAEKAWGAGSEFARNFKSEMAKARKEAVDNVEELESKVTGVKEVLKEIKNNEVGAVVRGTVEEFKTVRKSDFQLSTLVKEAHERNKLMKKGNDLLEDIKKRAERPPVRVVGGLA